MLVGFTLQISWSQISLFAVIIDELIWSILSFTIIEVEFEAFHSLLRVMKYVSITQNSFLSFFLFIFRYFA